MKTLARLTDKVIFNKEGLSHNRAVYRSLVLLRNSDNLYACKIAKDNDLILLLGKGSDNYQAIEDRKEYYSEKEEAIKAIKLANNL